MNSPQPDCSGQAEAATVATACHRIAEVFRRHGLATASLDARLLVCSACGITHEQFAASPERAVEPGEKALMDVLKQRRLSGEPVSRLVGRREFWGLPFVLGPETLDPRPDTETVVGAAIELAREMAPLPSRPLRLLDLGTGTGCILLSVLHSLKGAAGVGIDISEAAIAVAKENAERLGLDRRARFICGMWLDAIAGAFDLVVCNPPYIPNRELAGLEPEVARFDPERALDGGADGLDAYRQIIPDLGAALHPGGWVVFEFGAGQGNSVRHILHENGFSLAPDESRTWRDLSGHERCIAARLPRKGG